SAASAPSSSVAKKACPERCGFGSAAGGVGLGLGAGPLGAVLQGLDGARLVDVHDGVELGGEARLEVVALPLRVGPVDDPDRALEERLGEDGAPVAAAGEQEEARDARRVEERLV